MGKDKLTKEEIKLKQQEEALNKKKKEISKKRKAIQRRKNNIKLYPIYIMLSFDFLFYYPIIYLFLTQVKSFSPTQVLIADTILTISIGFCEIFVSWFENRSGKKKLLFIGNLLLCNAIIGIMYSPNFPFLILMEIFCAIGWAFKNVCEPNLLYDSIKVSKKRGSIYSKIDSKASSNFFYLESIASLLSGFLYCINPYFPLCMTFLCAFISLVLSFRFKDINLIEEKEKIRIEKYANKEHNRKLDRKLTKEVRKRKNIPFLRYCKSLKESVEHVKSSKRLRYLFLLNCCVYGMISGTVDMKSVILSDLEIPSYMFGVIFAMLELIAGFASRYQGKIHKMFKNRSLTFLAVPTCLSFIFLGYVTKDEGIAKYFLVFILMAIPYMARRPFVGLMQRYICNFTNNKVRTQLTSFKHITCYITSAIISGSCAILLTYTNSSNTLIVLGCFYAIAVFELLDKMKTTVGLKPELYDDEEVKYAPDKEKIYAKKQLNKFKNEGVTIETNV